MDFGVHAKLAFSNGVNQAQPRDTRPRGKVRAHHQGALRLWARSGVRPKMTLLFAHDHATTARVIPWCGRLHELALGDRLLRCGCGWTCDRGQNAALVILRKGLALSPDQTVGLDWPELTPLEREALRRILGSNPYVRVSSIKEKAPLFRGGGGVHSERLSKPYTQGINARASTSSRSATGQPLCRG